MVAGFSDWFVGCANLILVGSLYCVCGGVAVGFGCCGFVVCWFGVWCCCVVELYVWLLLRGWYNIVILFLGLLLWLFVLRFMCC